MRPIGPGNAIIYGAGDEIEVRGTDGGARILLIAGRPLREPVVWFGPFVMNTRAQIEQTLREFQDGTFLKRYSD